MRTFARLIEKHVGAHLHSRGFTYRETLYRRERPGGLVNLVGFDNGGRNTNRFRVLVGFNDHGALPLPNNGFVLARYFTGGSLSGAARELDCSDGRALERRLQRFRECFDPVIEPFFAAIATRSELAVAIANEPQSDYVRGRLYFADGRFAEAEAELTLYLHRLRSVQAAFGSSSTVEATVSEVEGLLAQGRANRAP
jgi:hypothetical protein